jgi:hypothetical protein
MHENDWLTLPAGPSSVVVESMPTDLDELSSHPAILKSEECRVKSEQPDEVALMPVFSLLYYATSCNY